jgi:2-dehydropantoate 2-reductase
MPRIDPQSHAPWHILGAGSIGCLFAAHLRLAGASTQVILRDADSLALWHAVGGIELRDERGSRLVAMPALAGAAPAASVDRLLVCTKAHQTRAALEALRDSIAASALIVLLQNGMGVREQVTALLPDAIVLNALSTEGAYQVERFRVVHAGRGET